MLYLIKKIVLIIFIFCSLSTSLLAANNLTDNEKTMSAVLEKRQLIKLSQKEFIKQIDDVSKYPNIQAYF